MLVDDYIQTDPPQIDWQGIEDGIVMRIRVLHDASKAASDTSPEMAHAFVGGVLGPAIWHLAAFCACVDVKDERN